jgi:hypothetical protein
VVAERACHHEGVQRKHPIWHLDRSESGRVARREEIPGRRGATERRVRASH